MSAPPPIADALRGLARAAREHAVAQRDLLGWQHGERAFAGPRVVQIDLANTCNARCVACWLHSDRVPAADLPDGARRHQLPWDLLVPLLDELRALGTEEIYLAGGGEPLTHPRAWEALERIVSLGFTCSLHTNFTLVDEAGIEALASLPVHHVTASVWAGSEGAYADTHPGSPPAQLRGVLERLSRLNARKRGRPVTKLYHVVTALNWRDAEAMFAAARETGSDAVELALADLIPGRTDSLALDATARAALGERVRGWLARDPRARPRLLGGDDLLRRLEGSAEDPGRFDAGIVHRVPCTAGWTYARVMADGRVVPCLKAHRAPSGDLRSASFTAIWEGEAQRLFRRETRVLRKDSPFFRGIGNAPGQERGCERGCDNLAENLATHARWRALSPAERGAIRLVARGRGGRPT
ncbi:radical SAM protein [Myxococcota bacterium]|nr:radical SAM protein [Myxococcota bacterium]